jgi:hypothetical protein
MALGPWADRLGIKPWQRGRTPKAANEQARLGAAMPLNSARLCSRLNRPFVPQEGRSCFNAGEIHAR